jgi:hypothetical protein
MLKAENLDQAFSVVDDWLKDVEVLVAQVAVDLGQYLLRTVLESSPQYTGDFTANWKLYVNTVTAEQDFIGGIFNKEFPDDTPFKRGDSPAINYALSMNKGRGAGMKIGDTLWLANAAKHVDLYAWKVENGTLRLRPENFGGHGPLRKAKLFVTAQFSEITKHNVGKLKL